MLIFITCGAEIGMSIFAKKLPALLGAGSAFGRKRAIKGE